MEGKGRMVQNPPVSRGPQKFGPVISITCFLKNCNVFIIIIKLEVLYYTTPILALSM